MGRRVHPRRRPVSRLLHGEVGRQDRGDGARDDPAAAGVSQAQVHHIILDEAQGEPPPGQAYQGAHHVQSR